jgi:putative Mg2+ transporter-C (MgtC) family protein
MDTWQTELLLLGRLVVAALVGGVVGWERHGAGKSAGLRTLSLVCTGSAFFTVVAGLPLPRGEPDAALELDPIRIVQAVAIGIGFLGAGVVRVRSRGISGLTTAAAIWSTAALGIAVGAGHLLLATGGVVLLLVILRGTERLERSDVE